MLKDLATASETKVVVGALQGNCAGYELLDVRGRGELLDDGVFILTGRIGRAECRSFAAVQSPAFHVVAGSVADLLAVPTRAAELLAGSS